MQPHAYPTTEVRRLPYWRGLVLWLCAVSLLIALASRVPRFSESETSWVQSGSPQMTAKLLAKDIYLLQPPASGFFTFLRTILIWKAAEEERPVLATSLDNSLYTRPPPTL